MTRQRSNFTTFLFLSAMLHIAVLGASLVHWPWSRAAIPVRVTPVTLLTSKQIAAMAAAAQSQQPQAAQAEIPVPDAPPDAPTPEPSPEPPEPPPAPRPAPKPKIPPPAPQPAPKPKAEPKPAPTPKPAPKPKPTEKAPDKTPPAPPKPEAKATPSRPDPGFDLDALAQSIQRDSHKTSGPPRSAAPKGPTRQELDLQQRVAEGAAKAAINDFRSGIADQLSRAWRPNCGVEGAGALRIRVRLTLSRDGGLIEAKLVDYGDENTISDPIVRAAATRALSAARTSAPYKGLPPVNTYDQWKTFIVAFDGKNVC